MSKIGIFSGFYLPHLGGVERYTDKLSAALVKLGHEVVIVAANHDAAALPGVELMGKRTIYRLPIRSFAKSRYPIPHKNKEYQSLLKQIEQEHIDYFIVNTRFYLTSHIGAKLGELAGRPVFLIEHGTDHFSVNNRWLDYFGKLYEHLLASSIKNKITGYYGVSKKCNEWLKHFGITASGVFYNAIDPADEMQVKDLYKKRYPSNEVVVSFAGRLIREKGILNLLAAFEDVRQKHPELPLKLAIAGDGELFEQIKRDYQDSALDLLGRLDFAHVMALYKRTDIFVNPSQYPEGLPTSILEAGLMSCAVIATPKGGTEEVITDGQHGIISDGSVKSLSEAIAFLATNPTKRHMYARAIKKRVTTVFNWDKTANAVDQAIKDSK